MSCNCGKKSCSKCCPRTIRGEKGATGPAGPRGLTGSVGPQGPAGTVTWTEVGATIDQSIGVGGGVTNVTSATATLTAGTYAVFFETEYHVTGGDETGTYGIYLDGVLQNSARIIRPTGSPPGTIPFCNLKIAIHGLVTATAGQVLTIAVNCTAGTSIVITGPFSLMYQKTSP